MGTKNLITLCILVHLRNVDADLGAQPEVMKKDMYIKKYVIHILAVTAISESVFALIIIDTISLHYFPLYSKPCQEGP